MNNFLKRFSLFSMFALSSIFAYVSYTLNRGDKHNLGEDLWGADIAEGASCATTISCSNGSGSGSGTATASGSGTGTSACACAEGEI